MLPLLLVTACQTVHTAPAHPELRLSHASALVDEPIAVTVENVSPGESLRIRATTYDQRGRPWTAEATYRADSAGRLDLATNPPLAGSYASADPMGLFWSATPDVEGATLAHRPGLDYVTVLELFVGGESVDRDTLVRRFDAPDVRREAVHVGPVVGAFYRPTGEALAPAVVVFAGSDGGLESAEWRAALLASRGFTALAVAVFDYSGRPDTLVEIPLEDAAAAVDW
ncbi:MAG: acyl-CoA thioesterase/BAAT N-terminal domain-containing protein, partial [Bacteroidota bacterium]